MVITDDPELAPEVAVTVELPAALPVTMPLLDTVALVVSLDLQSITRPLRTAPVLSRRIAESVCVVPTRTVTVAGLTVIDATGAATETFTLTFRAALPEVCAVIVTGPPRLLPVTCPALLTEAVLFLELDHVREQSGTLRFD
jgi:hypothetical protein